MDGRMKDGWIDEGMVKWMDSWGRDAQMGGWMDGWVGGWVDGWRDG